MALNVKPILDRLLEPDSISTITSVKLSIFGVPLAGTDSEIFIRQYLICHPSDEMIFKKEPGSLVDGFSFSVVRRFQHYISSLDSRFEMAASEQTAFQYFADFYPYMFNASLLVRDAYAEEAYNLGKIQPIRTFRVNSPSSQKAEFHHDFCITGPISLLKQDILVPYIEVPKSKPEVIKDRFEDIDL